MLQRDSFHEVAGPVFVQAVEELTCRYVETVMDATREDHDVSTLVFLLEPREAAGLHDTAEGLRRMGQQTRKRSAEVRAESQQLAERHRELRESLDKNKDRG